MARRLPSNRYTELCPSGRKDVSARRKLVGADQLPVGKDTGCGRFRRWTDGFEQSGCLPAFACQVAETDETLAVKSGTCRAVQMERAVRSAIT